MTKFLAESVSYFLLAKGLASPASQNVKADASISMGKTGSETTIIYVPMEIFVKCIKNGQAEILNAKQKDEQFISKGSFARCLENAFPEVAWLDVRPNMPFGSIEV